MAHWLTGDAATIWIIEYCSVILCAKVRVLDSWNMQVNSLKTIKTTCWNWTPGEMYSALSTVNYLYLMRRCCGSGSRWCKRVAAPMAPVAPGKRSRCAFLSETWAALIVFDMCALSADEVLLSCGAAGLRAVSLYNAQFVPHDPTALQNV